MNKAGKPSPAGKNKKEGTEEILVEEAEEADQDIDDDDSKPRTDDDNYRFDMPEVDKEKFINPEDDDDEEEEEEDQNNDDDEAQRAAMQKQNRMYNVSVEE